MDGSHVRAPLPFRWTGYSIFVSEADLPEALRNLVPRELARPAAKAKPKPKAKTPVALARREAFPRKADPSGEINEVTISWIQRAKKYPAPGGREKFRWAFQADQMVAPDPDLRVIADIAVLFNAGKGAIFPQVTETSKPTGWIPVNRIGFIEEIASGAVAGTGYCSALAAEQTHRPESDISALRIWESRRHATYPRGPCCYSEDDGPPSCMGGMGRVLRASGQPHGSPPRTDLFARRGKMEVRTERVGDRAGEELDRSYYKDDATLRHRSYIFLGGCACSQGSGTWWPDHRSLSFG